MPKAGRFDDRNEGYLTDLALLDRLAAERLSTATVPGYRGVICPSDLAIR
jgi:hypothetical protein